MYWLKSCAFICSVLVITLYQVDAKIKEGECDGEYNHYCKNNFNKDVTNVVITNGKSSIDILGLL